MTDIQKIIKYAAIALAIFIIIMIASAILKIFIGITSLTRIFGLINNNKELDKQMTLTTFSNTEILALEIEVDYADLKIKTGDTFKVETSSEDIKCKQENTEIKIKEDNRKLFPKDEMKELIIYIPQNLELEKVKINSGAGKIEIQKLIAQKLTCELGAGETVIENLKISKQCDIEGGAGKINIKYGTINNLDLDMGVGETILSSTLTGKNEINAGVGNLDINLNGKKEEYQIKTNKGFGAIKVDGQQAISGQIFGDGINKIQVDGGIGNIDIQFEELTEI